MSDGHLRRLAVEIEDGCIGQARSAALDDGSPTRLVRGEVAYVPDSLLEALKARLRQEVDAHRMTLHEHALPMSDEEFDELLGTIPGLEDQS